MIPASWYLQPYVISPRGWAGLTDSFVKNWIPVLMSFPRLGYKRLWFPHGCSPTHSCLGHLLEQASCHFMRQPCGEAPRARNWSRPLQELPRAAVANRHTPVGLNQTHILSRFWRLEFQNQGIRRDMLPLKALEKDLSLPLLSFWWLPGIAGIPWLQLSSLHSLPPSSQGLLPRGSTCLLAFLGILSSYQDTSHRI